MAFQIVKIPDLPVASTVISTDRFAIETNTGTKQISQSVIDTYNASTFLRKNINETTSGTITAASFTASSSKKIKTKIQPLSSDYIEALLQLRPVAYKFKKNSPVKPGQADIGLIAEEVREFLPELVCEDDKGNLSLDYAKLSVVLLLAIQGILSRE